MGVSTLVRDRPPDPSGATRGVLEERVTATP
jgi:hypothetical protein